jgi:DNA-binding CsgD family transcriptional regulator
MAWCCGASPAWPNRAETATRQAGYGCRIEPKHADGEHAPPDEPADAIRRVLGVVALDVTGEIGVVRAVLDEIGVEPAILVSAESEGFLRFDGLRVEFVDVARRSAALTAISATECRSFHRAFARVMTEPRHRVQRGEHLASAAVGPDLEAANALAQLGQEASERGEPALAGELFMRAGGLSPDPENRALQLFHAGDGYWNTGQYTAARAAFDAAYQGATGPLLRADIAVQLGQLDMYQRGPRYSRDLFVAAAEAVEPHDIDRAAMLLVHAASTVMLSGDVIGSLALVRRAGALAGPGSGGSAIAVSLLLAYVSFHHGDVETFEELFPPLSKIADDLIESDIADVDLFLQLVGMVHVYTEQWDAGRMYLGAVVHRAGRRARVATAALASATLAELCWRSGRWDEAWALATSDLVTEVTLTGARLWLLAFTAHLDAGFGRATECRARARAALAEAEPMEFGTAIMWAYHALGLLELGLGHPVAAASHLDHIDVIATAHEIIEPSGMWWQADHVEALIRSGRPHEAARALHRFEDAAALSQRAWALATASRCRALMAATHDDAERWFDESLSHHDRLVAPFELARTLLCRAERRVAMGSQLDPSADLAEAVAIFDALGATSWSAQGSALADAITAGGEPELEEVLSPAERRVAEAVVAGMTNREVAASLFLSEKTVEFHLHNVYRKLDVRSRTQLVRRFSSP